jgi:hypothetical protein
LKIKYFFEVVSEFNKDLKFSKGSNLRIFNFWNMNTPKDLWFYKFFNFRDIIPSGRRLSIYSVFGDRAKMLLDIGSKKIFFTGENPVNRRNYLDHCLDDVDLSLGFDYISAKNYLRFPLWYVFFIDPVANLQSIKHWIERIESKSQSNDLRFRKFCCLVASHDPTGHREFVFNLLSQFDTVDSGGVLLNNTSDLVIKFDNQKYSFLEQYCYNICFENSDRLGYVTEKIFDSLLSGCIPIYWGSGGMPELGILNQQRILFFDPDDPTLLFDRIRDLSNPISFNQFINQPVFVKGAEEIIFRKLQDLECLVKALY